MPEGSVGSVFLDLVVRDTVEKQVQAMAEKAQAKTKQSFAGMEQAVEAAVEKAVAKATKAAAAAASSASRAANQAADAAQKAVQAAASSATSCGQQVENTIDKSFSKSVAIAQSKVAQLEKAFDAVTSQLDGQWYSGAFDPASKATQNLLAQQEKLMAKLEAAQERLAIEVQAAAQKRAAAEAVAAEKAAKADAAAKAKQEAAAQKAAAAQQKAARQAAAAQEREAKKNEVAQKKAAQAAAKAHEQSASRIKNAFTKAFSGAKKMASGFGNTMDRMKGKFSSIGKSAGAFGSRLKSIVSGALVFNVLSAALRKVTDYLGDAVSSSSEMKNALANLKGAAMTAAQPIVEMLTPALTALTNGAATALSYLSQLISFFTGKTVASMSNAAKKIHSTAASAKKAMASIAGFDEIQRLDGKDSGSSGEVEPNFNFQGKSSFLDSVMESVKAGNWGGIGTLVSEKLNGCLHSIKWPNIQEKVSSWVSGFVEGINGFVQNLDFGAVGSTIGESVNTIVMSVGSFFAKMDWTSLGSGIGKGISSIFTSINWEQYKQALTEGFNGALELVSGFASGFVPLQGIDFTAAIESLQRLWESVWDFAELVGGALASVYNTVLKPILKWTIKSAVPAAVDVFTAAFEALSAILTPVMEGLDGLMVGLEPVIAFIEDVAMVALEGLRGIFEKVGQVFAEKGTKIQEIMSGVGEIISVVCTLVEPAMVAMKEVFGAVFGYIGDKVSKTIGFAIDILHGLVKFVAGVFTGDWGKAWDGVVSIFEGIVGAIKGTINSVISFINGLISGVCSGVNTLINAMNRLRWEVPDWVPWMGGKTFGFNLKTITAPQIPMLANGGVITQPTLAMMGEYSGANHNPEIVAPQSIIEQTVAKVLGSFSSDIIQCFDAVLVVLKEILDAIYGCDTGIDSKAVYDMWDAERRKRTVMTGGSW